MEISPLPTVTVLYFAVARERAKTSSEQLPFSEQAKTVRGLLAELGRRHPELVPVIPHLRVAVDQEFVGLDAPVAPGSEVALIPPVAGGGGGLFRVSASPVRLEEVVEAVRGNSVGGVVTFLGTVRGESHAKRVVGLEYEAFVPMAEKCLREIGEEVRARWPDVGLAVVHRVGSLSPGEVAVAIAAAAPHRKEAFLACEFAIDRLKEKVPIWKKELTEDGAVWVGLGP